MLNRVVAGVDGVRIGLHVCRGNWSRKEEVLLAGDYAPLLPAFRAMDVQQFVLEYATPRAGDIAVVGPALAGRELGLGVVNPRSAEAEDPEAVVARVEAALAWFAPRQIFLNPDCGFGTFASRCVNDDATAALKLRSLVAAATTLRERHG